MRQSRLLVPLFALTLAACGGGPRPIDEPPPLRDTAPRETLRPTPRQAGVPVPAASIPQALAGPLTVARVEPYMDALETDLRRHVHGRGLVTQRRGNEIVIVVGNDLLFAPDDGLAGDDVLDPLAAILKGYVHTAIAVNGYTDTSGTPQRNLLVSDHRAHAVAGALIHEGVAASRVRAQGFGEANLRVRTGEGVKEPRNRRIEVAITPLPG